MRTQISLTIEDDALDLRKVLFKACVVIAGACIPALIVMAPTNATSSSTINFQARLESASGAIVPDGYYNVEFKLYSASSGGVAEWTEDYTYNSGAGSSDARLHVANGYITVNLGSITAFPNTINWNQQQWLTMNIGGTSNTSTTWDGEMSPRLQLTAVPYAFQAGTLGTTNGANVATLDFTAPTATRAIHLPDASGTVCLQSSSACGFATGSGAAFLQGGNSFGAQAELGTNDAYQLAFRTNNADRIILDTSGNLTFQQASTISVVSAATGTQLAIQGGSATSGTNVGGNLLLEGGVGASTGASGSVIIKSNTNNSTTALAVETNTGTSVVNVDTANQTLTVRAGSDQITEGSNLYSGDFSTGWTVTGWNTSISTQATHNTGNTNALVNTSVAITAGVTYEVHFTIGGSCGAATEHVAVSLGGVTKYTANGNECGGQDTAFVVTASTAAGLTFTPTTNWSGTISGIDIYLITGVINPAIVLQNASGTTNLEVRASSDYSTTYIGFESGQYDTGGSNNTSLGANALQYNTYGYGNVGVGAYALQKNTTGWQDVAVGEGALGYNTTGADNIGVGYFALSSNRAGSGNIGIGTESLSVNITGSSNIALNGLAQNTTGSGNIAIGYGSLFYNTTGSDNLAIGYGAGYQDSGGSFDTLANLQNATAIGANTQVQASNSIVLGSVDTATKVGIGITVPSNTFSVSPLDYQTGTVTRTNGSATLVGTGTTWTSAMVGDLIVFADGTTNTMSAFTNATHITMGATYTGTTDATPVYYRFHKPGFNVTSAGNAFVQNTSTTAFQVQKASGAAVLTVNTSTGQVTVGGNLSVSGNTTITGAITSLGGTSTVGSFGVPAVIAQGNYTTSSTGLNAIYNSGNVPQGWYRVSVQLKNTVASGSTFCYIVYTDADTGSSNNVFPWFDRSTDGTQVTINGTVNMTVAVYTGTPISLYTSNNTAISIVYGVTGATPTADKVHYVVERMY